MKPANVIVNLFDRCKLTDFGCSFALSDSSTSANAANQLPASTTTPRSAASTMTTTPRRHLLAASGRPGGCGTLQYRAPELLKLSATVSFESDGVGDRLVKSDIYSLGVTLWQLAERRTPFAGRFDSPLSIAYNVVKYGARPDGSSSSPRRQCDVTSVTRDDCEGDYRRLYVRCWDDNADRRPDAGELVQVFGVWRCPSRSAFVSGRGDCTSSRQDG